MLGEEIRARRKRLGLTQKALAALINVKPTTMCQYENGTNEMSFAVLKNIAEVLKCSTVDLAYEELGILSDPQADGNGTAENQKARFIDPKDEEFIKLLMDLDAFAKDKVLSYMRDQKALTKYYEILRRHKHTETN